MLEVAPVLRDYGLRVVALDAPGFGASPALAAERYEVDATLTLVERLLDVLGFARVVFMGHSWGGALAVHLAGRSPGRVSELVLLDSGHLDYGDLPYVESERSLEEWIAAAGEHPARWPSWEAMLADVRAGSRRWSEGIEALLREGVRIEPGGEVVAIPTAETRGAVFHAIARARQSEVWPALGAAGLPVLLLTATEPPELRMQNEAGVERFRAAVPQADVVAVENAGHSLLTDVGPELGHVIGRWLAGR